MELVITLSRIVKTGLSIKVPFRQRLDGGEGFIHGAISGKVFQTMMSQCQGSGMGVCWCNQGIAGRQSSWNNIYKEDCRKWRQWGNWGQILWTLAFALRELESHLRHYRGMTWSDWSFKRTTPFWSVENIPQIGRLFCKEPESKYLRLCGLYSFSHNYSTLLL